MIRAASDPLSLAAAARQAINRLTPTCPPPGVRTMEARLSEMIAQRRLRMTLLVAYGD